jgi:hypothetical protein
LISLASSVLGESGFAIRSRKTNVMTGRARELTGLLLTGGVHLRPELIAAAESEVERLLQQSEPVAADRIDRLRGIAGFAKHINREQASRLAGLVEELGPGIEVREARAAPADSRRCRGGKRCRAHKRGKGRSAGDDDMVLE